MYITSEITGKQTIDLPYPIDNRDEMYEVAIMNLFSENVFYELKTRLEMKFTDESKVLSAQTKLESGVYSSRELKSLISGNVDTSKISFDPNIEKQNKMVNITKCIFLLREINNSDNFVNNQCSDALLVYHVLDYQDITFFEPAHLQYKKMKADIITALNIEITDQNNQPIHHLGINITLHVRSKI